MKRGAAARGRAARGAVGALTVAIALAAAAGCAKKQDGGEDKRPETGLSISETELRRGGDACAAFQEKACALAAKKPERADLKEACALAPARSDAMRTALEIARHPESARRDVLQAQASLRKTMDLCVEGVAKLDAEPQ